MYMLLLTKYVHLMSIYIMSTKVNVIRYNTSIETPTSHQIFMPNLIKKDVILNWRYCILQILYHSQHATNYQKTVQVFFTTESGDIADLSDVSTLNNNTTYWNRPPFGLSPDCRKTERSLLHLISLITLLYDWCIM